MDLEKIIKFLVILTNFSNSSINILHRYRNRNLNNFLEHKINNKTILVTEAIMSHGEVIPGIVKYCLDLGYNVDVLLVDENFAEKPLEIFKKNKCVKVFHFGLEQYKQVIHSELIKKYKNVIFTSSRVYYEHKIYKERFVLDYLNNTIPEEKIVLIEHHLDLLEDKNKQKYKMAGLPEFSVKSGIKMINSHYYGKFKSHKKNRIVKFITAGGIEKERKNHDLLISAVKQLLSKNIYNFEIIVVGDGKMSIDDSEVKNKVKTTGRVTYEQLYKYMEDADYILPLLDPDNLNHERYIKDGTSGTFQLCYGFLKPMIINEHFAAPHGFSSENAILYSGNNLAEKMEYAIKQNQAEYKKLVENIRIQERDIYKKSLDNMESYIGKVKK